MDNIVKLYLCEKFPLATVTIRPTLPPQIKILNAHLKSQVLCTCVETSTC
jgi:hypothetical protein